MTRFLYSVSALGAVAAIVALVLAYRTEGVHVSILAIALAVIPYVLASSLDRALRDDGGEKK